MSMSVSRQLLKKVVDLPALHQYNPERYPFLLQSVVQGGSGSHYSILFAFPQETITCDKPDDALDFFSRLEKALEGSKSLGSIVSDLPFSGGWFVFIGYEALKGIEPTVECHDFPFAYPVAFATRCPAAIIVDHALKQTSLIAEAGHDEMIKELLRDLDAFQPTEDRPPPFATGLVEEAEEGYLQGVNRILEYIKAGDVFQVNLSRAWQGRLSDDPSTLAIYQSLCRSNPAPFACLIHHKQGDIIGSSPERLIQSRDGWVETRPIAGTRPRSGDNQDQRWLEELRTDHKERAEHIMLIDLERNDLGRLCEPGSITVDELMTLESYAHVHHIVSNIKGKLRPEISPVDVLKAVFPGGTITGCPKVRCMEIIAELEQQGRGPYTGSAGYINYDGSMDFNILIRTLFRQGEQLHFRAGAGIVSDSNPERELSETRQKAKGLLLAFNRA